MVGNAASDAKCYMYRRSPEELAKEEDAEKEVAIEKATKVQHFMTSFTAEMGHIQITVESLDNDKKAIAYECISKIVKPTDGISASSNYDDTA